MLITEGSGLSGSVWLLERRLTRCSSSASSALEGQGGCWRRPSSQPATPEQQSRLCYGNSYLEQHNYAGWCYNSQGHKARKCSCTNPSPLQGHWQVTHCTGSVRVLPCSLGLVSQWGLGSLQPQVPSLRWTRCVLFLSILCDPPQNI